MKVRKNYIKVMSLVALLGFTACGGGGSKGPSAREIMSKKDGVVIFYSYPQDVCHSNVFKELVEQKRGMKNILLQVESNDVTCDTYNKSSLTCRVDDSVGTGEKSCVVGFDVDINRKTEGLSIIDEENLFEKMIIGADKSTQLMF